MDEVTDPIVFVGELSRIPMLRRTIAGPGETIVYVTRRGKLEQPRGGFTAGEIWWRAPRTVYVVDLRQHRLTLDSAPAGSDLPMLAYLEVTWRVLDAQRAVASQPIDVVEECRRRFVPQLFRLGQLHAGVDHVDVSDAVRADLRLPIDTPNGLRIEDCVVWLGARRPLASHDTPEQPPKPEPMRPGERDHDLAGVTAGTRAMPPSMDPYDADPHVAVGEPGAAGGHGALVHAQLVPDTVTITSADVVPLDIVVDNHDSRARSVRLQLGGAMYRYSSPQLSTVDVPANSQFRLLVEVTTSRTEPEGGRVHGLTVTATDAEDGTVLGRSTGRIAIRALPALDGESPGPHHVSDPAAAAIPVILRNRGNLPLDVDVCPTSSYWWVRRPGSRRARRQIAALDAGIGSVISKPVVHVRVNPGERRTVELRLTLPRYRLGFTERRWVVPVGLRPAGWAPICVLLEIRQQASRTINLPS